MTRWHTLLAIDFDKWAAETYRANFPGVRVECGPVANYVGALPPADVILGGPPCQPFSDAGENEGEGDERDCIPDFCSAVADVMPRMFLMENVRGLLKEKHLPYFGRVLSRLESSCHVGVSYSGGYVVQYRLLDAVSFGVPQFRERIWVWGIRKDLYAAGVRHQWPKPTHAWPPPEGCMFGAALHPGVTVRQALGLDGWLRRDRGKGLLERHGERRDHPTDEPAPLISAGVAGSGARYTFIQSHADEPVSIDRPGPTLRSGGNGHDGCCLRVGAEVRVIGAGSNPHFIGEERTERDITDEPSPTIPCGDRFGNVLPVVKWRWSDAMLDKQPPIELDKPCPTIVKNWHKGLPYGSLKWKQDETGLWIRRLHPLECARLQSVPDSFVWLPEMPKGAAYKIVGNGWASGMAAVMSDALSSADPDSKTVIDLFCGGGLGACGWHGQYWSYQAGTGVAA